MVLVRLSTFRPKVALGRTSLGGRRNANWFLKMLLLDPDPETEKERPLYNWDESPHQSIRTRAAYIRAKAKCPVTNKPVQFVCPYSGIPTHHDEEAWKNDKEYHDNEVFKKLRMVNLYEHDLKSGRPFHEFEFPGPVPLDSTPALNSWDSFFYTRDFPPMNTEFNLAVATKVLTYPITIASLLHKFSPYQVQPKGSLTLEGLRSLSALRYSLYSYNKQNELGAVFRERPMRIFLVGARMEAMIPGFVWKQLTYLFPGQKFEFHFIGPLAYFDHKTKQFAPVDRPHGRPLQFRYDEQITLHYHTKYFNELFDTGDLFPFDPYLDCFFLFHPGFQTADKIHWDKSLHGLLESKCPVFVTGYHDLDIQREYSWLRMHPLWEETDVLMEPCSNIFGSTKLDLVDYNPTEVYQANSHMFAFRGKRYHAIKT